MNNKSSPLTIAISLKNKSLRWSPWSHQSCNYHWEIQLGSLQTQTFINYGSILFLYSHTLIVVIEGHRREIQPRRFSHYKCHVTNCPLCLQTVASKIPYRRVVFRNKIRSGTLLQAIPRSLPGCPHSTVVANVYSKSTIWLHWTRPIKLLSKFFSVRCNYYSNYMSTWIVRTFRNSLKTRWLPSWLFSTCISLTWTLFS
jgi:hypothetical protein